MLIHVLRESSENGGGEPDLYRSLVRVFVVHDELVAGRLTVKYALRMLVERSARIIKRHSGSAWKLFAFRLEHALSRRPTSGPAGPTQSGIVIEFSDSVSSALILAALTYIWTKGASSQDQ